MRRGVFISLALCAASFALPGRAQPLPDYPLNPNDPALTQSLQLVPTLRPVPANGAILFWATELEVIDLAAPPPAVQLARDEAGSFRTFPGSVHRVDGSYWAFTPDEPLEPGRYVVSIATVIGSGLTTEIEVSASAAIEPPRSLSAELTAVRWVLPGVVELCGSVTIPSPEQAVAYVRAELSPAAPFAVHDQFLYRIFTGDYDFTPFRALDDLLAAGPFTRQAEEYCVHVEVMSIATGDVYDYPELTMCAPHGNLGDLVESMPRLPDDLLHRDTCSSPLATHAPQWCEVNADCIDLESEDGTFSDESCADYFLYCSRPNGGHRGVEPDEDGGADMEPPRAGTSGDAHATGRRSSSGCSIAPRRPAPFALLSLAPLMLLLGRARARRWLASSALAMLGASAALPVRAQDYVTVPIDVREAEGFAVAIVDEDSPVPSNGSFLFWLSQYEPMFTQPPIVQVARTVGESTQTFGGSLRRVIGAYWTWKAVEPLEPGAYVVSVSDPSFGPDQAMIEVAPEAVIEPPSFTAALLAVRYDTVVAEASCGNQIFVTRVTASAYVEAGFDFASPPEVAHQFLYRLVKDELDETPFRTWDEVRAAGPFTSEAESYCVRIEVMDIETNTVHAYPDELCAPHGDIGALGERDLAVPDSALRYDLCAVPPAGFEERWCRVNDECIDVWRNEALARATGCFNYYSYCPDAMRPDAGQPDAPDPGSSDGGSRPDGGAWQQSDGGGEAPLHGTGCGCRAVRAAAPSAPGLWAFLVFIVAAWRAPRLRARRSRDLAG